MPESLRSKISEAQSAVSAYQSVADSDKQLLVSVDKRIVEAKESAAHLTDTVSFLKVCITSQTNVKNDLELMNTNMLRSLWDDTFEFKYVETYDDNGAIKGLVPTVFENGHPSATVANGGGMRNVLGALTRMQFLLLRPQNSPVIVWDEFGNNMDESKFGAFFDIVKFVQMKTDLQVIAISHSSHKFEQEFNVQRVNKVSKVTHTV